MFGMKATAALVHSERSSMGDYAGRFWSSIKDYRKLAATEIYCFSQADVTRKQFECSLWFKGVKKEAHYLSESISNDAHDYLRHVDNR